MRHWQKSLRPRLQAALCGGVLLSFVLAFGQTAWPKILAEGEVSLGVGVQSDNNIYLVPDNEQQKPVRDTVLLILPQATLTMQEHEDSLTVDYYGEYLDYREQTEESKWLHYLYANLDYRRWSPFSLAVSEQNIPVPRDLGEPTENTNDLLNRNTLSVEPGFAWHLNPTTSVELSYREEWLTYPGEADTDESIRRTGRCVVGRRWSPTWRNSLTIEGGGVERKLGENYSTYHLNLSSTKEWELLNLSIGLDWERHAFPGSYVELLTPRFSAVRTLPRQGYLRFSYWSSVSDWYTGDTEKASSGTVELLLNFPGGSSIQSRVFVQNRTFTLSGEEDHVWGPILDGTVMLTGWMGFVIRGGWTESVYNADTWRMDRHLLGESSILLHLGGHFALQGGVTYLQNHSTDESYSYDDDRIWATLTWFSRELLPGERPETPDRFQTAIQMRRTRANDQ